MVAFRAFSLVAAIACAAFSYAAPVSPVDNGLLDSRCGCTTLPNVVTGLEAKVELITKELYVAETTAVAIEPIILKIESCLNDAIAQVKVLVGVETDIVLSTGTGIIAVVDLAKIVASVVCLILNALAYVLRVVVAADKEVIVPLLVRVIILVAYLLQLILGLVAGLLYALLPLIKDVLYVIVDLKVVNVFAAIGIYTVMPVG